MKMNGALTPHEDGPGKGKDARFLCDEMLGKLAKWLRLLGYDTSYIKTKDDGILLVIAEQEGRILLTRDKALHQRAKDSAYILSDDPDEQLQQVFQDYKLSKDKALTICSVCGRSLRQVVKEKAEGKVPEKVYELQDEFWYCAKCHKFYWKGTHVEKIVGRIEKL
jgi:uncharacterized protein with PIN domain